MVRCTARKNKFELKVKPSKFSSLIAHLEQLDKKTLSPNFKVGKRNSHAAVFAGLLMVA